MGLPSLVWVAHQIPGGPKWNKNAKEGWIHSLLELTSHFLLPLDTGAPGSQVFGLQLNDTTSFPGSDRWWDFSVSRVVCTIHLLLYILVHTLLVLSIKP